MVVLILVFQGNSKLFSTVAMPVYMTTSSIQEGSFFSIPFPEIFICRPFNDGLEGISFDFTISWSFFCLFKIYLTSRRPRNGIPRTTVPWPYSTVYCDFMRLIVLLHILHNTQHIQYTIRSFRDKFQIILGCLKYLCQRFVVQLLSGVHPFVTQWTATRQASLSSTISRSLLTFMPTQLMMLSNHFLCCPPLLLPSVFPTSV